MSVTLHNFLTTACRKEIVKRALMTAAIVGTLLAAINHGAEILAMDVSPLRAFRIVLTYVVPYCVSTYAATMQELRSR